MAFLGRVVFGAFSGWKIWAAAVSTLLSSGAFRSLGSALGGGVGQASVGFL